MNIAFLIGNGFDIASGLKTSYKEFYNWYLNKPNSCEVVKILKNDIAQDISHNLNNWSDFEIGLGKFTDRFTQDSAVDFFCCYEDVRENLLEFLNTQMEKFKNVDLETKRDDLIFGILNFSTELPEMQKRLFSSILDHWNIDYKFMSFNYTSAIDKYVKLISSKEVELEDTLMARKRIIKIDPEVIHIHGTLDTYSIFGVNDISQISNHTLLSIPGFQNIMLKSKSIDTIGSSSYVDAFEIIDWSEIICIYGMSLGDSDRVWWNKICLWLQSNKDHRLIIYWYEPELKNNNSILTFYIRIGEIKNKLLRFFDDNEANQDIDIRERIYIIFNSTRVFFPNLNSGDKELTLI